MGTHTDPTAHSGATDTAWVQMYSGAATACTVGVRYGLYYSARLRGVNSGGPGDWSNEVAVGMIAGVPEPPAQALVSTFDQDGVTFLFPALPWSNGDSITQLRLETVDASFNETYLVGFTGPMMVPVSSPGLSASVMAYAFNSYGWSDAGPIKTQASSPAPVFKMSSNGVTIQDGGTYSESVLLSSSSSAVTAFQIQNVGTDTLSVTDVAARSSVAWLISVAPTLFTLAPNATQNLTLTVQPSAVGVTSVTLRITHDGYFNGGYSDAIFALTTTAPTLDLTPTSVAASVIRPTPSNSVTVSVLNSGTGKLTVSNIAKNGSFLTVSKTTLTVLAGATGSFTVTCTDSTSLSVRQYTASVTLTHNINTAGATSTVVPVTFNVDQWEVQASATSLVASGLYQADTQASTQVTLNNIGSLSADVSTLTCSGAFTNNEVAVWPTLPATISAGASQVLTLSFAIGTKTMGYYAGTLILNTTASASLSISLAYNVSVVAPNYTVGTGLATPSFYAQAYVGSTASVSSFILIQNTGTADLELAFTLATLACASLVSDPTAVVAPGGSFSLVVSFSPTGLVGGNYTSTLTVAHNDPPGTGGSATYEVRFWVVEGIISINATSASLTAGFSLTDPASSTSAIISNTGSGTLSVSSVASSLSWVTVDQAVFQVSPGQSHTLVIIYDYAARAPAVYTLTLTLTHDASTSPDTISTTATVLASGIFSASPALFSGSYRVDVVTNYIDVTISLSNTGTAAYTLQGLTVIGQVISTTTIADATTSATVAAGASSQPFTFRLYFLNTDSMDAIGNFVFNYTAAPAARTFAVPYTISIRASSVDVSPVAVSHQYLFAAASVTETITLTNSDPTNSAELTIPCNVSWLVPSQAVSPDTITLAAASQLTVLVTIDVPILPKGTQVGSCSVSTTDGKTTAIVFTISVAAEIFTDWTLPSQSGTVGSGSMSVSIPLRSLTAAAVRIESFSSMDFPAFLNTLQPVDTLIPANTMQIFTFLITFGANATRGVYSGNVNITYDYPVSGTTAELPFNITLTSPGCSLSPSSLSQTLRIDRDATGDSTVTITNTGNENLQLTPSLDSAVPWASIVNPSSFSSPIAPAASRTLSVHFTGLVSAGVSSTLVGVQNANVVLTHNAEVPNSVSNVSLSLTLQAPAVTLSSPSVDRSVRFGEDCSSAQVTLNNTGNYNLVVLYLYTEPTVDWLNPFLSLNTPATLLPLQTATINLAFACADVAAGTHETEVVLDHDAPVAGSESRFTVRLEVASRPFIRTIDPVTQSVRLGETNATVSLLVANDGDATLVVSSTAVSGTLPGTVSWRGGSAGSLQPSAQDYLDAVLDLSGVVAAATLAGAFTLTTNSFPQEVIVVSYSLDVQAPQIAFSPASVLWSARRGLTTPGSATFTVSNAGTYQLAVSVIEEVTDMSWLIVNTAELIIAPGATGSVSLAFQPDALSVTQSVNLSLAHDAPIPGSSSLVPITMKLQFPVLEANNISTSFPALPAGMFLDDSLVVQNTGDWELSILNAQSNATFLVVDPESVITFPINVPVGGQASLPVCHVCVCVCVCVCVFVLCVCVCVCVGGGGCVVYVCGCVDVWV